MILEVILIIMSKKLLNFGLINFPPIINYHFFRVHEVALSTINYLAVVYETDLIDDKEYLRDSHLYILNKVDRE